MTNIVRLPVWKKHINPGDMLRDLAELADENPSEYEHIIVMHCQQGHLPEWESYGNAPLSPALGFIELLKLDIVKSVKDK